jgi:DNA-directed RNA polymerase subunit alpha
MNNIFLSKSVDIKKNSETDTKGVFEITGLYTGYGITLGNALRRALLSSLPGAAVTQFKIKGIKHEFSTIPGILDDVVEISMNLKKIRFQVYSDEPQTLVLKKKGSGDVVAGDIKPNAQVEIVNSDVRIATITSKSAEIDMEITVERGLGYSPVETRKIEKLPIGAIAIDAMFTPVTNVDFEVENMRVGDRTDYNRLIITIETDSTLSPSKALQDASNILKEHIEIISGVKVEEKNKPKTGENMKSSKAKQTKKTTKK